MPKPDPELVLAAQKLRNGHGDLEAVRVLLASLLDAASHPHPLTMTRISSEIARTLLVGPDASAEVDSGVLHT